MARRKKPKAPKRKRNRPKRYQCKEAVGIDFTDASREDGWDWDAPCRDPLDDAVDRPGIDAQWAASVPVFHSTQDLPVSVRRQLARHDWRFYPRHGDGDHVTEVQNELKEERRSQVPLFHGAMYGSLHTLAKLTEVDVTEIVRRKAEGETYQALADEHGVSRTAVWNAINGRSWRHVKRTG